MHEGLLVLRNRQIMSPPPHYTDLKVIHASRAVKRLFGREIMLKQKFHHNELLELPKFIPVSGTAASSQDNDEKISERLLLEGGSRQSSNSHK